MKHCREVYTLKGSVLFCTEIFREVDVCPAIASLSVPWRSAMPWSLSHKKCSHFWICVCCLCSKEFYFLFSCSSKSSLIRQPQHAMSDSASQLTLRVWMHFFFLIHRHKLAGKWRVYYLKCAETFLEFYLYTAVCQCVFTLHVCRVQDGGKARSEWLWEGWTLIAVYFFASWFSTPCTYRQMNCPVCK